MLPKRMFLGALFLIALVMFDGCVTTGEPEDRSLSQYQQASYECLCWGHRRDSYDYQRCIEKKLESRK